MNKTDGSYLVSHSDGQGTLLSQTDGAGQVVTIYANDVSGQVEADDGGYGYAEPEVFPIRYAGEQYDAESDLIYLRARYYDPNAGRFLSRDMFGGYATSPQSKNRYSYASNNPANGTELVSRQVCKLGRRRGCGKVENSGWQEHRHLR